MRPNTNAGFTRKGLAGILVLFVLILVAGGLYWFWGYSTQRNYISCYDGDITRYIDIPPYSKRLSPVEHELIGHAKLEIGVTQDQVNTFLGAMCTRKGFIFRSNPDMLEIEISPTYIMKGTYDQNNLTLLWVPKLSERLQKKVSPELASLSLVLHAPPVKKKN